MFAGLEKERKKEKIDRKHTKKEMIHTDNLYCYYFAVLLFLFLDASEANDIYTRFQIRHSNPLKYIQFAHTSH